MSIPVYSDLDLQNNQAVNLRLEQAHAGAKVQGSIWQDTTTKHPKFYDGTADRELCAPTVYTQAVAATTWGPFSNLRARPCTVTLIDSTGAEFEADILHAADYLTVTVTLKNAMSGKLILT